VTTILTAIGREALWWLLLPVDAVFCITLTLTTWGALWLVLRAVDALVGLAARFWARHS
jgi:hypothetical protein